MLWLKRKGRFAQAMHAGTVEPLCRALRRDMPTLLCKEKRQRQTSQKLLEESGPPRERYAQHEAPQVSQAA